MELPKTEQELQTLIDEKVKSATADLVSEHNGAMASLRKKHADELEKAKKQATMSAEEIAAEKAKELAQANENELNELRSFKKTTILKDKLSKAGLPHFLVNDSRLLSAEEGELDKVIKTVKAEYEETQPRGTTRSTVVPTSGSTPQKGVNSVFEDVGSSIKQIIK